MALLLLKLRYVPEDELEEIQLMLEEHEIEHYLTPAGNWGMSIPALWIQNDRQHAEAKGLLEAYAEQRQAIARADYNSLKEAGEQRTVMDMMRENPVRYIAYIVLVAALVFISIGPFVQLI